MFRFACMILALAAACSAAAIPEERIVGGTNAVSGQVPWQVSLRYLNSHFCGGSIVNERWILTAAHCLGTYSTSMITVVTNTLRLNSGGDVYRASRSIVHPKYDEELIRNDVGLIKVRSDIVFSSTVQPVALPTSAFTAVDYPAVVSGWGLTSANGNLPNALQFLDVKVVSQDECLALDPIVTNDNICTFTKYGQGNCNGDSGGPLTADGVLIGIISFVIPCGVGAPDGYVRVYSFIDWITGYTG